MFIVYQSLSNITSSPRNWRCRSWGSSLFYIPRPSVSNNVLPCWVKAESHITWLPVVQSHPCHCKTKENHGIHLALKFTPSMLVREPKLEGLVVVLAWFRGWKREKKRSLWWDGAGATEAEVRGMVPRRKTKSLWRFYGRLSLIFLCIETAYSLSSSLQKSLLALTWMPFSRYFSRLLSFLSHTPTHAELTEYFHSVKLNQIR